MSVLYDKMKWTKAARDRYAAKEGDEKRYTSEDREWRQLVFKELNFALTKFAEGMREARKEAERKLAAIHLKVSGGKEGELCELELMQRELLLAEHLPTNTQLDELTKVEAK